jgi:hypothetical protein
LVTIEDKFMEKLLQQFKIFKEQREVELKKKTAKIGENKFKEF